MGSLIHDVKSIFQTPKDDWKAVQSHAIKKPFFPIGNTQKRYLHLTELVKICERYALPDFTPDETDQWYREVVKSLDAANVYSIEPIDTAAIEKAAKQWFVDINQNNYWVTGCNSDLNGI